MQWSDFFAGLALYLVIEGLMPFASPGGWRRSLELLKRLNDGQLRMFGLAMMIAGIVMLLVVRGAG
ncbi:MAG: DUF2065 domain-containing protein [Gammaproteobacteria bacterium]|nr:DUF2065 domain-containing protein [Gammaproteobacteria bacterium]